MHVAKGLRPVQPPAHVWSAIRKRLNLPPERSPRRWARSLALAASIVLVVVVFALVKLLAPWFQPASGLVAQAIALVALVGLGLVVYLGAAELFGAAKFRSLISDMGA